MKGKSHWWFIDFEQFRTLCLSVLDFFVIWFLSFGILQTFYSSEKTVGN